MNQLFKRGEKMKKMVISWLLFVLLCCTSVVWAGGMKSKTISLGQWIFIRGYVMTGQFVAYDGQCATIFRNYKVGTVRVCKDLPAHIFLDSISTVVIVKYDGGSVVNVSSIE